LKITRREFAFGTFALGTAALALGGAAAALSRFPQLGLDFVQPARADDPSPSVADLMQPNPLGEMSMGNEERADYRHRIRIDDLSALRALFRGDVSGIEETLHRYRQGALHVPGIPPLDRLALAGFVLARCASADKYFPLIETLFATQRDWVVEKPLGPMYAIAKQAGLTPAGLRGLPGQSAIDRGHREGAQPSVREVRGQFHADLLRQRQAHARRPLDRGV